MSSPSRHAEHQLSQITIVGGGLAGLTAAITCAEGGARVSLFEAHATLGGRARSSDGPYKANLGPHALYKDGPFWRWMAARKLLPSHAGPPLAGVRFRWQGELRRTPPLGAIPSVLRLRGREAPAELPFRTWAAQHTDERTAAMLSAAAGVFSFHHDPGELSAAFVWPRTVRALLSPLPVARYALGGWSAVVGSLEARARELGVVIETGCAVGELPEPPVIVATELNAARELLGDNGLRWTSGRTLCIDVALRRRRGDPFVVSDLDEAGWVERFTAPDPSLAPAGEELVQAQMPIRPEEDAERAAARLERLLDSSLPDWRERETWRRRQVMDACSGALDMPGTSWRDRPAVDRGDGVFLAGDMVAAPGLLAEVAWASAVEAGQLALRATAGSPSLRRVA
ncbi:MAG TPA: NAD(P)-binding protein [Solirubrobacteraceae bacterium]|jgi:phytoene dehydrogenase-like protein|nr:NAD(P)-binding protein [Solirubrobacteraceae bacterium]